MQQHPPKTSANLGSVWRAPDPLHQLVNSRVGDSNLTNKNLTRAQRRDAYPLVEHCLGGWVNRGRWSRRPAGVIGRAAVSGAQPTSSVCWVRVGTRLIRQGSESRGLGKLYVIRIS